MFWIGMDAGGGGISAGTIVAIVVPISVAVLLCIVGICFLSRRARKKRDSVKEGKSKDPRKRYSFFPLFFQMNDFILRVCFGFLDVDGISTVESLQFSFGTIEAATNSFSADNKLGEGGFGEVFKVRN